MARAVVLLTAAIAVLLTAFAWPSVRSSVHDVSIAVAGPAAAVEQIRAALQQGPPTLRSCGLMLPGSAARSPIWRLRYDLRDCDGRAV
ncbi:hypothetical protein [Nonomuraea wenchangensis]|uniref:hypothetical protein n=1 Tax=Nonomuraea wenchangensis TaxID=568860 RepID=UPI000B87ADA7|nr:hypothetical protein [Nonomuraea wenchangensis]